MGCAFNWCNKDFGTPHPWIPGETVVTCDYYPRYEIAYSSVCITNRRSALKSDLSLEENYRSFKIVCHFAIFRHKTFDIMTTNIYPR